MKNYWIKLFYLVIISVIVLFNASQIKAITSPLPTQDAQAWAGFNDCNYQYFSSGWASVNGSTAWTSPCSSSEIPGEGWIGLQLNSDKITKICYYIATESMSTGTCIEAGQSAWSSEIHGNVGGGDANYIRTGVQVFSDPTKPRLKSIGLSFNGSGQITNTTATTNNGLNWTQPINQQDRIRGFNSIKIALTSLETLPPLVTLDRITISPQNISLNPMAQQQFRATAYYTNGNNQDVTNSTTWSVNTNIGTIISSGLFTATNTSRTETGEIRASYSENGKTVSGQSSVMIVPLTILDYVTISPQNITLNPTAQQQFQAIAYYTNGNNRNITSSATWSADANVGTINSSGFFTAANTSKTEIGEARVSYSENGKTVGGQSSVTIYVFTPQPIIEFQSDKYSIDDGQTITLSWNSSYSNNCIASDGWSGQKPLNGTQIITPTSNSNYVLICSGIGGYTTKSLTVNVKKLTPVFSFTARPNVINHGQSSNLSWDAPYANSCTASGGWSDTRTIKGTETVSPSATRAYILTCTGDNGPITKSLTIAVRQPLPVVSLISSTKTISDQPIKLSWASTDASTCTASGGWSGAKTLNGSQSVNPLATTTYTLVCSGAGGRTIKSITLSLAAKKPTLDLVFTAQAETIDGQRTINLNWNSTNIDTCTASEGWMGDKPTSGSQDVSPDSRTIYTLTCSGMNNTISKSIIIDNPTFVANEKTTPYISPFASIINSLGSFFAYLFSCQGLKWILLIMFLLLITMSIALWNLSEKSKVT